MTGGIIISATGLVFTILSLYNLATASTVSFLKNLPVASAALLVTFLEVFIPVFVAVSNYCFRYLIEKVQANNKNPWPLTYFLVLGYIEWCRVAKLKERVISIY